MLLPVGSDVHTAPPPSVGVTTNDDPKGTRNLRLNREYRAAVQSEEDALKSAGHLGHLLRTTIFCLYHRCESLDSHSLSLTAEGLKWQPARGRRSSRPRLLFLTSHGRNRATTSFHNLRLRSPSGTCAAVTKRGLSQDRPGRSPARHLRLLPGHAHPCLETSGTLGAFSARGCPRRST